MAKVLLDIDSKNVKTVLTILENLNPNLIKKISVQNSKVKQANLDNEVIKELEETKKVISSSNRYLSRDEYKKRLSERRK